MQTVDLAVQYRQKNGDKTMAVSGLSLSVAPGEVVGFLGPNGAGKSSTIKCLMGFVEPHAGSASIFGLKAGSISAKRRVGYLPEVALYYPFLTPYETLDLYGKVQGLSGKSLRTEIDNLLEIVGLGAAKKKQNRTLSKGMLQRVGIAQSLLGSPELLMLDEVTSGLDPVGRKELRQLLKERQKAGCTLFFSSHELAEVEMLCDRILLIHKGRLVEERDLGSLKEELRKFSLEFVGHTSMVGLTSELEDFGGNRIRANFTTKALLLEAVDRAKTGGAKIVDIVSEEGSLEDYFIDKIQEAA